MRHFLISAITLLSLMPAGAAERAGYDSRGRIIALLSDAGQVPVQSNYIALLPNGKRVTLLERPVGRGGPRSQGQERSWFGTYDIPDGSALRVEWKTEDGAAGLRYATTATVESPMEVDAIEFVLDLPRDLFVNGRVVPDGAPPVPLPAKMPQAASVYKGRASGVRLENGAGTVSISVGFGEARDVAIIDRWEVEGNAYTLQLPLEGGMIGTVYANVSRRSYRIRVPLLKKEDLQAAAKASLTATLSLANKTVSSPVNLTLDSARPRYAFDGFGGNYCWDNAKGNQAIQQYIIKNLKHAWARTELKIVPWDRQKNNPGPEIRFDLEMMRQLHKMNVPYAISIWRLPERFYIDRWEKNRGARFRQIRPEKWDELNELIGSYLLYAKKEYGVEPDLFSFNEPNLGVQVGLTPEGHTEQIKQMGAAFRKMGLKTKMLLGDAVPARNTHSFVLDAAADAEAMQYVTAIAFHSWGGASPEHYAAWGDVAEWLNLPLLVTELGVDSSAYATNAWDTYHYGLREAQHTQEILLYARPQGTQFWQYTDDYALARTRPDGTVEPTARFWMMKHFTDLTPMKSEALTTAADQKDVTLTAFRKGPAIALHIVNVAGARAATLNGVPEGEWLITESTEEAQYQQKKRVRSKSGVLSLTLPSRSIVTLTLEAGPTAAHN